MNASGDHQELDRLSADLAGVLGRIGLDPAAGRSERRERIDTRFAAAAARHAGRVAAQDGEGASTYLELDWLADDVARRLSGRAGPGAAVAVRVRRSHVSAAAVVGVMRAGAAVLPLESGHRAGLQEFMMREAGVEMVVSDGVLLRDEVPVAKTGRFVIAVRPRVRAVCEIGPGAAFVALPAGGEPGRAAGVRVVSHLDVLAWVDAVVPLLEAGPYDVWASFHSMSLEVGMREPWGPLLSGGRMVVAGREAAGDAGAFVRLLAGHGVTVLTQLPSAFARLTQAALGSTLPSLRHVLLAGEPVEGGVVARWRESGIAPAAVVRDVSGSPAVL
ncbi:AMP-binding protein [Streptomyces subrutilus]|uniref:AMP-dependent synthetase/ligase domain-containing protein n=1 Tax=Streptomyces subrutilus TaxID=36818 RepID=A0A5P2UEY3_9ACTN|nr:AMP-binding protein [Streptomyces subrutilus]QEU77019.1 hypothetical protein CP968_00640 [Streptomyces subrutilus]WSJ27914.1 AMP-binding protein [Streptomyces subrutilus]GGZ98004.1 hypothetical protein GCM10010371_67190 [Streptomyces subrutilus]